MSRDIHLKYLELGSKMSHDPFSRTPGMEIPSAREGQGHLVPLPFHAEFRKRRNGAEEKRGRAKES